MKDPLAQAGKDVLVHAAEFALEKGVTMALDSLAAGKRAVPYIYTVFLFFLSKYACTFPKETLFLSTDLIVLFLAKITRHPIRLLHSLHASGTKSYGSSLQDQSLEIRNALF